MALEPISSENLHAVCDLSEREDQQHFIDDNAFVIAEALFAPHWTMRAIATEDGEIVGMITYGIEPGRQGVIHHVMVDQEHQGNGYGPQAMTIAMRELADAGADCVDLSYWGKNPAAKLYARLGFEHTGEHWEDEPVMRWPIPRES